ATLQYLLGEALIRAGAAPGEAQFREAKLALQKSVRLNPKFGPAHADLAKLLLKESALDTAIEHLELARNLDPTDKSAYSQLAIAYRRKGKLDVAAAMLADLNKLNDEERVKVGHRKRLHAITAPDASPQEPAQ